MSEYDSSDHPVSVVIVVAVVVAVVVVVNFFYLFLNHCTDISWSTKFFLIETSLFTKTKLCKQG